MACITHDDHIEISCDWPRCKNTYSYPRERLVSRDEWVTEFLVAPDGDDESLFREHHCREAGHLVAKHVDGWYGRNGMDLYCPDHAGAAYDRHQIMQTDYVMAREIEKKKRAEELLDAEGLRDESLLIEAPGDLSSSQGVLRYLWENPDTVWSISNGNESGTLWTAHWKVEDGRVLSVTDSPAHYGGWEPYSIGAALSAIENEMRMVRENDGRPEGRFKPPAT